MKTSRPNSYPSIAEEKMKTIKFNMKKRGKKSG